MYTGSLALRSTVSKVSWPAIPGARGAPILGLLHQMAQAEVAPPEWLVDRQMQALVRLVDHARRTVPHYGDLPEGRAVVSGSDPAATWRAQVPLLGRAELRRAGSDVASREVPEDHLPVAELVTSGSSGYPVTVLTTRVAQLFWRATTLRDHLWHGRDLSARLAAVRADLHEEIPDEGLDVDNWGSATAGLVATGGCGVLSVRCDVATQARWLLDQDPTYLMSYPSNIEALAQHFAAEGLELPGLRQVRTYGEALDARVRDLCRQVWGVEVVDAYSCQEAGYLALQCPAGTGYHVQSETVYLEVLDDAGEPCSPGEVGRVVVTPLHNHAMPLIRYDIGDYAEVGRPCDCGRRLPVLAKVQGRVRNMWVNPAGQRFWPIFSSWSWGAIEPLRQLQLVQHALDHVEARLVAERPMTDAERDTFAAELRAAMARQSYDTPFRLRFTYLDAIDRSGSAKFEDFVCCV